ncbi:MAG: esterase family protein, partial [Armatimonadetes bacterium]|nr:esterase family protein [Armatimonadota bacterium]
NNPMIYLSMLSLVLTQSAGPKVRPVPVVDVANLPTYGGGLSDGDYALSQPYANAKELTARANVPKGKLLQFTMESTDSKMYPGISKTAPGVVPYQRKVSVYVPSQLDSSKPAPLIVSQDSMGVNILPTILDNMIADKRLPAMVAVMLNSGGGDSLGSQRGLEYDTVSGKYAEFIEREVLPRVTVECGVTFTKDPNARMTMGGSSGAACAFTMAWFHPEWYRRVLSYSGTFVNQQSPTNPDSPHGAWEYHESLIRRRKPKPLRVWLEVGENDFRSKDPESTYHNWVLANQRMAGVLKAANYQYQFVFARDAGHVDGRVVGQTLPDALEWVWKGYRPRK